MEFGKASADELCVFIGSGFPMVNLPLIPQKPARLVCAWLLAFQGVAGLAWWGVLLGWPGTRAYFFSAEAGETTLWAFALADLLLFAGLSVVCAVGIARNAFWAGAVLLLHAGGTLYASLFCWGLLFSSDFQIWLGAAAMTPPACFVLWLSWHFSLRSLEPCSIPSMPE